MNKKSLKLGTIVSYIWVVVHVGINLILTPLLISSMGENEYGLYQVIASFLAYISVLETSISSAVLRYYCKENASGDHKAVENLLAICRRIYCALSVCTIFVAAGVILAFKTFYQSSFTEAEVNEGMLMLFLLFVNLIVTLLNAIYVAAINGNERFVFLKTLSIINQIIQPVLCIVILKFYPYALTATCIQVSLNCVMSMIRHIYARNELNIKPVLHNYDKKLRNSIFVFAVGILLANLADQIFLKTDQLILGKLYNTGTVAVYSIGSQIYSNYMYVGITIASVFFPRVSKLYHEDKGIMKISDLFIKVGRIAFLACFLVLSAFVILGKEFLYLWVGESFLEAYGIAIVVMIPFTIDIIQHLGLTILQVMNRYSFRAKMYFIAALLNIISTSIFAYLWSGFGAALSTGLSMFVTSGIILNYFYSKSICLNIKLFWRNIFGILIKMTSVFICGLIIYYMLPFQYSWLHFIVFGLLYTLLYFVVAYFFAMNAYEKGIIRYLFKRIKLRG